MRRTMTRLALVVAGLPFAALGCDNKGGDAPAPGVAAEANTAAAPAATAAPTTAAAATAEAAAPAAAATTAEPAGAAAPADKGAAAPADKGAAAPAATAGSQEGEKTFECGGKGQKLCPMQAWMKGTMAAASSSGDGEKLSQALSYVAGKAPPGMGTWSSIAKAGATKAKAGDVDGAKESCKQCHDAYKDKYKKTMRDHPW